MTDVFIVGGGPAGLAAALAWRARGFSVVVADSGHPPIDKACGEGLMPDSLEALAELGVHLDGVPASHPFRGIRFLGANSQVAATFPTGEGIGLRRTVLHEMMIERAAAVGVEMRWGATVSDPDSIQARWIIGADGQKSKVRQWSGLDATRRESRRYGFSRHYRMAPWADKVEVYWAPDCQMYVTPVGPDEVCVALISKNQHFRHDDAASRFPQLMARLAGHAQTTVERGAVSATRSLRRVVKGNVALLGDASGSVDAITGEGLCLAFRQAPHLAAALEDGDLESYQEWHRIMMRRPRLMADLMLVLDRLPAVRETALRVLEMQPGIFAGLLKVHVLGGDFCLQRFAPAFLR